MAKKYIKIKAEHLDGWNKREALIIDAPCGAGKTTAVKDIVKMMGERLGRTCKTLVIAPRSPLTEQEAKDYADVKSIAVATYQYLQAIPSPENFLNAFDLVVIDEAHALICDNFNNSMFNLINSIAQSYRGRVLMLTATDPGLVQLCDCVGIVSHVIRWAPDHSWVRDGVVYGCQTLATVAWEIVDDVKRGGLPLVFADKISDLQKIEEEIAEEELKVLYIVSKSSDKWGRLCKMNAKHIDELIETGRVPEGYNAVFASKTLEVGVNIHDDRVKSVFIASNSFVSAEQMAGRKRRKKGEEVKVFIKIPTARELETERKAVEKAVSTYELYRDHYHLFAAEHKNGIYDPYGVLKTVPAAGKDIRADYRVDFCKLIYYRNQLATVLDYRTTERKNGEKVKEFDFVKKLEEAFENDVMILPNREAERMYKQTAGKVYEGEEKAELYEIIGAMVGKSIKSPASINKIFTAMDLPYKAEQNRGRSRRGIEIIKM